MAQRNRVHGSVVLISKALEGTTAQHATAQLPAVPASAMQALLGQHGARAQTKTTKAV